MAACACWARSSIAPPFPLTSGASAARRFCSSLALSVLLVPAVASQVWAIWQIAWPA